MNEIKDFKMKVKELLNSPEKWTQNACARDQNGKSVLLFAPEAVCWCLVGAINRCYGEYGYDDVVERVERNLNCDVIGWNDSSDRKFDDVKALVEKINI